MEVILNSGDAIFIPLAWRHRFSLKDTQFMDTEASSEWIKKLEQSEFIFLVLFALQISQAGDYIASTGARIFDLKTKQVFFIISL